MMEYAISYREICHLVNRSWHMSVLYRPNCWQLSNTVRNIHSSRLCFHPLNHNHDTKEASQTPACTQTSIFRVQNVCYVHYEQTLSTAIHHTSKFRQLPENLKPCCDLPKKSTFPSLLLCLLHWNSHTATTSSQHTEARQMHKHFLCSNSQIPQITTCTEWKIRGNIISQRHKRLWRS